MLNQKSLWAISFILLLSLPVSAAEIDFKNPPEGVFFDQWYSAMLNNTKSGYLHQTFKRSQRNGRDIVVSSIITELKIGRVGQAMSVSMKQQSMETLDGRPLAFADATMLGAAPIVTKGVFRDGNKVVITTKAQHGPESTKTHTLPGKPLMGWGTVLAELEHPMEPGTKYEIKTYEPSISQDELTPVIVEHLAWEEIDLFGRKVRALKSKETVVIKGLMGQTKMESTSWIDEEGMPLKMVMEVMGMPIEMIACSKTVAQADIEPAEMMNQTLIPVKAKIDRDKARKVTYKITARKSDVEEDLEQLPQTDKQQVVRKDKNSVILEVWKSSAIPDGTKKELTAEEQALYTASTPLLDYKDDQVKKLVEEAAGDETDPRKLAERFTRYVDEYVESKNLSVGFATASEVARSKEGDCSEHGVLLAALGRGKGIPTRLVTGLVYADGLLGQNRRIFGGHMWAQYWLDGRWVDFDAAFGQTDVDATHIAFSFMAGENEGAADMVSSFWMLLGELKIEVLEASPAEAVERP